jgi:hypothetical protein
MSRGLLLNVAPISYDDSSTVSIEMVGYKDKEQLEELRNAHRETHLVRRSGNQIQLVPVAEEASDLGYRHKTVDLGKDVYLAAALARNSLLNFLHGLGRKILDFDPIEFVASGSNSDLLAASMPQGVRCPEWLAVCLLYEAKVRVISLDRQKPFVGLSLNVRTTRVIDESCDVLAESGLSLRSLYVGRRQPHHDPRVAPRFRLMGRVRSVSDGLLELDDCRPGSETVAIDEAFLESRTDSFNACMTHAFGSRADEVRWALEQNLVRIRGGTGRLQRLKTILEYLSRQHFQMVPGVGFGVGDFLSQKTDARRFRGVQRAPRAVYVFDPTGARTDTWHDRGLNKHGPYTSQSFTPTRPRICVVCQRHRKGRVEQFLYKLVNGIPAKHPDDRAPFAQGFVRKYDIEEPSIEFFLVEGDTAEAYRRAARGAIEHATEQDFRWDLALVQIEEQFHNLFGDENPYLVTKSAFLTQQIPVQEFEIETAHAPDGQLAYVLNNIALAAYSKLGGIPWLVKADPTIAHELVFGLGSAHVGRGRLGDRDRIVGITTVFTGDGNYWLSSLSKAVPIEDYESALLESLRSTIGKVKQQMNWQEREHVRLVFHAFKPFKSVEVEAVKALMGELGDYDVDYAFIHVVEDHPYLLFDEQQKGFWDRQARGKKGVLAPTRGLFLRLSGREILISLTGAREVKRPEDGMPRPMLLRLHPDSSFDDTTYLSRQIFTFASHSWRSFFPAPLPVTVFYSELIARMLGQLRQVPHWNPDVMLGRIGRTRWFL